MKLSYTNSRFRCHDGGNPKIVVDEWQLQIILACIPSHVLPELGSSSQSLDCCFLGLKLRFDASLQYRGCHFGQLSDQRL